MSSSSLSTQTPAPHTTGESAALFTGATGKEVEYPVAPEAEPTPAVTSVAVLASQHQEWQRDRVLAMAAVGALLLLGLVLMFRFNRTVSQHAARAQAIDNRVAKIEGDNSRLAEQLRRSRAELAITHQQLDAAQTAIDALERGPRSNSGVSGKRLASGAPRSSITRSR